MRRVLFIAYLFPPIVNSGTRRSLSFVNHLPNYGWDPHVLSVENPPAHICDAALSDEVRTNTSIDRVEMGSNVLAHYLARATPHAYREKVTDGLAWRLKCLINAPDEVASWYPLAVQRGVNIHRDKGFDVIYASGWPWTSFLIARAISKRTGCPYVIDYRDLWKPTGTHKWENQTRLQSFVNPVLERFAARSAAAVITVTPTLVETIKRNAGINAVHCITNGYEPADFSNAPINENSSGFVHVTYTGVWRPGYGLEDLYKAIRYLKDINFTYLNRLRVSVAGFIPGPAREFGIDDIVHEMGIIQHELAVELMNNADLLFLPVPEGFYATASLPGKLFEYIGSSRPILAAVPKNSEVARVLSEVGGSIQVAPGDSNQVAYIIQSLCLGNIESIIGPRRPEKLQRYTRATTTEMLSRVLDAVHNRIEVEPIV